MAEWLIFGVIYLWAGIWLCIDAERCDGPFPSDGPEKWVPLALIVAWPIIMLVAFSPFDPAKPWRLRGKGKERDD